MTLRPALLLLPLAAAISAPAQAREAVIDVPAGSVEEVVIAIARQTGSSVVVTDRGLATRKVTALRGSFSAREALEVVARAAGGRVVRAGSNAWRLEPAARAHQWVSQKPRPAAPPPPALPPEGFAEDPIVVIGSKSDMTLRDYPGQVSRIEGKDLEFGGAGGTDRIAARVASVSTTHLGSGRNKLFIRGIADSSFTGPTQSTVGQYLGDLRLSYNSPDPDLRLTDLAVVEVLEGPQGTLYGAGSLGGIVRLVPNAPDLAQNRLGGGVGSSVTAHGKPSIDANVMLNLPIAADRAALRVSANGEVQGGYIDKPLLGRDDVNRTTLASGRASLRLDAGNGWSVDVIGVGQVTQGDDSQYADRFGDPLSRSAAVREGYRATYSQGQIVLDGELGRIKIRSSTGIAWQYLRERYDATIPGDQPRLFEQTNKTRMIANETRAWMPLGDRFGWVLGSSFTSNTTNLLRDLGSETALLSSTGVTNKINEFTLYGEANLRLREGLILTGGGRATWTRLNGSGEDVMLDVAKAGAAITAARTETMLLPSAAITAQPTQRMTVYLRYQEGFRPGGLAIDGEFVRRFRNDQTATFEVGLRHGRPGRDPFDLSLSLSHTNWRDIQADFIDPFGLPTTANVGDGRIWTASLALGVKPAKGLRIDGGLVLNNSRISQPNLYTILGISGPFPASGGPLGAGDPLPEPGVDFYYLIKLAALLPLTQIPNVAKISARIGFDYRRPVGTDLELHVIGSARYVGRSRLGVGPELGALQGDYLETYLGARVGRDNLGATLSLSNLADAQGNRFSLGTPFAVGREQITPLRPFTVRLGIDASF